MRSVAASQRDQHSQLYVRLTRVHEARAVEHVTTDGPVPIEVLVHAELTCTDGTPEWRAWVERTAARLGLARCPDTPEELLT